MHLFCTCLLKFIWKDYKNYGKLQGKYTLTHLRQVKPLEALCSCRRNHFFQPLLYVVAAILVFNTCEQTGFMLQVKDCFQELKRLCTFWAFVKTFVDSGINRNKRILKSRYLKLTNQSAMSAFTDSLKQNVGLRDTARCQRAHCASGWGLTGRDKAMFHAVTHLHAYHTKFR